MGKDWGGNLGPGWTRIAPRKEEGFQVSKRDLGEKGISKRELAMGIGKGNWQGAAPWLSIVNLCICIMMIV
jgi:hypothetical protein